MNSEAVFDVTMPKLGLTMTSGTIARWLKAPGEAVAQGEPLLEVATDKINYEVAATAGGTLATLLGQEGDEFACGATIATISGGVAQTVVATSSDGRTNVSERNGERVIASPAARRLARERGVSLREMRGGGPRGRITLADVFAKSSSLPPAIAPPPRSEKSGVPAARRAIHRKMSDVGTLPLAQVQSVARVDRLAKLMQRRGDFGWTAFAVFAVSRLLRHQPVMRTDARSGEPFDEIDIGVAADTPAGLRVPVVRAAHLLSLAEIQAQVVRLGERARGGKLEIADVGGACFSISNVGPQGVDRVFPLVDPPQTAILGMGAAARRPAVVDDVLAVALTVECVVSFDHRFIDGAPAARFLASLVRSFEDPGVLL